MKKLLLLFLGTACSSVMFAQGVTKGSKQIGTAHAKVAASDKMGTSFSIRSTKKTRQALESFQSTFGVKEVVGRTTYDLQTNGSTQRRVQQSGNNISCGWTYSMEQFVSSTSPFNDRGTGYAYYNGSTWSAQPTARLENLRTGFGGFAGLGGSTEMYIAHDGTANNLIMNKKTGGTWSQSNLGTSTSKAAIWPHAASAGTWLYVLASSSDSNIHSNGVRNGVFLSRSNDGGASWIDDMIPMPLLDSVSHYRAGGNSYAISAQGSNVAVVIGDIGTDLTLFSSTDNGANWTKHTIWDWPINNYNFAGTDPTDYNNDMLVDTLWTTDGSQSVTIGANGKIHVAFPLVRVYKPGGSTGYNFFYTSNIAYWNSDLTPYTDSVIVVDNIFSILHDCDGDNIFGIGENYAAASGPDGIYNTIGTLTMPSITTTTGTPEKIMIAYTAIMDNDTTTDDPGPNNWSGSSALFGQNYRDVMIAGSDNNGASWTFPVNISRTGHFEEAYPSLAEQVSGNKLAVLYQADWEPGTILQNEDIYDDYFKNMMVCQVVNIDSIFNVLGKDSTAPCQQFQLPLSTNNLSVAMGDISVYPNPANNVVYVNAQLSKISKSVELEIADMTGRIVYTQSLNNVQSFVAPVNISNLATGNYILNVVTDFGRQTQKITKE